jgi:hypothetical protein
MTKTCLSVEILQITTLLHMVYVSSAYVSTYKCIGVPRWRENTQIGTDTQSQPFRVSCKELDVISTVAASIMCVPDPTLM